MISKRLSTLSSNKEAFLETKQEYETALRNSGHTEELKYQEPWSKYTRQRRKTDITWFNPPFSSNVATNIGHKFFIYCTDTSHATIYETVKPTRVNSALKLNANDASLSYAYVMMVLLRAISIEILSFY